MFMAPTLTQINTPWAIQEAGIDKQLELSHVHERRPRLDGQVMFHGLLLQGGAVCGTHLL